MQSSKLLYDRRSVGQSWCQAPSGDQDQIFITVGQLRFVDMGHPPRWEDGSVVYNCCWLSPALSFSDPSTVGLITIFCCLRFETPPNLQGQVPIFINPRNRVAQLYPQALGSLFVASYDYQGYCGGIRTILHAGKECKYSSKQYIRIQFVPHRKCITSPLQSPTG
jgi:hypothetical protein